MFTWDEKKRKLNLAKHGIDFHDANAIFDGPLVTVEDRREDYGERRYVALGVGGQPDAPIRGFYLASVHPARRLPCLLGVNAARPTLGVWGVNWASTAVDRSYGPTSKCLNGILAMEGGPDEQA